LDNTSPSSHRIHFLKEKVYKKIAAGEVIERPFSVVRELLDNAIDAKSTEISVYIEKGGLELIRVMDNGSGMTKEDLEICFLPHTTSKIEENEDLYKIHTLGFRGEALASIGVCSNLEITSKTEETETAHQLIVKDGNLISLSESAGQKGTVVVVSKLFYNMPARKQFLKSVSSETRMCNSVLVEKAIAHPQNTFRLYVNKGLNHFFAPGNIQNRIETAYKHLVTPGTLDTITLSEKDFKATLVLASPNFYRRDRKLFQTFVNKRRIFEYSLFQAVEYAYSGYMPGGQFPIAFLFLDLNPSLVDFNIHPANKKLSGPVQSVFK
jgi:DNA mismatch repair protein MutL